MISVHELLARVRIDQRLLDSWLGEGWLVPYLGSEPQFTDLDVARTRLIRELKEDLGVNDEGIGLILHLLDQVHGLRRQMRALMERCASDLRGTPLIKLNPQRLAKVSGGRERNNSEEWELVPSPPAHCSLAAGPPPSSSCSPLCESRRIAQAGTIREPCRFRVIYGFKRLPSDGEVLSCRDS